MFQSHYGADENGSRANFLITGMQGNLRETAHKTGHFNMPDENSGGRKSPFLG